MLRQETQQRRGDACAEDPPGGREEGRRGEYGPDVDCFCGEGGVGEGVARCPLNDTGRSSDLDTQHVPNVLPPGRIHTVEAHNDRLSSWRCFRLRPRVVEQCEPPLPHCRDHLRVDTIGAHR